MSDDFASTAALAHAPAPPVGLVELSTEPPPSTATHSAADGHDTPVSVLVESTVALDHVAAPPSGLVEVQTLPDSSTATQSDVEGQEIPLSGFAVMLATDHRAVAVAGVVVVSTLPIRSTAAQNELVGHEIAVRPLSPRLVPSMSAVVQVAGPPVGFDELTRSPLPSTARHSWALGHEIALSGAALPGSICTGTSQAIGSARAVAASSASATATPASLTDHRNSRAAAHASMTRANVSAAPRSSAGP